MNRIFERSWYKDHHTHRNALKSMITRKKSRLKNLMGHPYHIHTLQTEIKCKQCAKELSSLLMLDDLIDHLDTLSEM